ncbi:protein CYPRO4-like [Panicum virgatum]|uniref:Vacuolar import/degradation Vid27 C-terminal domain-containing protein n=1 Tax=Panicum virgatum TaxID=38727 RepID=A0A8T0XGB6_PANVG|nr:protein CYPRO4-like [Panicum virgatum]KAG2656414.1 hypothetical protein PVAP13_1KG081100 [Panicum virgatum]
MGGSHSREDLDLSDSDSEDAESRASDNSSDYGTPPPASASSKAASGAGAATPASIDAIDRHLRSLHLKYNEPISPNPSPGLAPTANPAALNAVKLYLHIGGSSPSAKWIVSDRLAAASFVRAGDDEDDDAPASGPWCLVVGSKIRARVGPELQLKTFPAQRRVDFVADGVWALKFLHADGFGDFCAKYHSCLFENSYGVAATDEGRAKVFGKDFAAWARPEDGDESIWEDATDGFSPGPKRSPMPPRTPAMKPLMEDLREFEEPVEEGSGIQSLALGALDNSFLVGDSGIQVVRNFEHGIHGKGMSVKFSGGSTNFSTPKKALLMRAETNMLLMSPATDGKPHAKGVHQLDIETGKVVSEWKFEKDGADINMRDITNDSKGAQMDPSESTFLGLDDNRLCRWDMRDRRGIVQNLATATESPVLQWTQGHQFSRGTNFQCFASTGDGSIVVGSLDGKIRLYSKSSMRMAKTAFPGLGSPITHLDVTYDGKWILGTTDTYLILICTIFIDKDGKEKTGFSGRMGHRIAAPRLLKLNPLDSHLAGANNRFREGRFSWVTENGKQERHLVATVGKYSVVWNFLQVKNSQHECYQYQEGLKSCYCYKVILKDESIVASRFMHDKYAISDSPEAPLVVATPMKVSSFSISSRH